MSDQVQDYIDMFRAAVVKERERQRQKWGTQTHTAPEWMAILTEEVGEAAAACCDQWIQGQPIEHMLKELVQVAAVAEAAFTDLQDNAWPTPPSSLASRSQRLPVWCWAGWRCVYQQSLRGRWQTRKHSASPPALWAYRARA